MAKYIDRQAAKDAIKREWDGCGGLHEAWAIIKDTCDAIDEVPPADVRPVVRGRWVRNNGKWCCDKCTCPVQVIRSPFCPNCGADLRGGDSK